MNEDSFTLQDRRDFEETKRALLALSFRVVRLEDSAP